MADEVLTDKAEAKGNEFAEQLIADRAQYKAAVRHFRRLYILAAIRSCGNNKAKACREFGIHPNTAVKGAQARMRIQKTVEVG